MGRKGFNLTQGTVGANLLDNDDAISALLMSGIAATGLALGASAMITTRKQAQALGIDAAYDSTNSVRVYRHIDEFFRMFQEGTPLWIMLYPQATTPVTALGATYAQKLISDANGAIRNFGIAYNPAAGYTPSYVDGMEANIRAAIPAGQTFADWTASTYRPIHFCIEGRGINVVAASSLNLRAIEISSVVVEYGNVSLMIGQDWDYAETQDAIGKKMADIGTLLGAIASRNVGENIAEVGAVNITSTPQGKWLTAGISSHVKCVDIDADLDNWDTNGYILGWDYQSSAAPGYRFNNDHSCAPITEDAENNINISSISLSRTNGKVFRQLRNAYLPKLRSVQAVDTVTGLLPIGTIKYLEGFGNDVFDTMEANREISGGTTQVDPTSNLVSGDKALAVGFQWVPLGTINQINGVVNIKAKLS